jgi:hypothetical protein
MRCPAAAAKLRAPDARRVALDRKQTGITAPEFAAASHDRELIGRL